MSYTETQFEEICSAVQSTLVHHAAFANATGRVNQVFRRSRISSEPICLPIIGESRTGKTTLLDELKSAHPRTRHDDGLEVPILQVKTPSEPTVMALAELLLAAVGDPRYNVGTKYQKTDRLITLMKAARTIVVSIDEFQHFVDKMSHKVLHHVADWLKVLVDEAKVGLIVAGLPRCQAVIEQNEQLRGRFLSSVTMPRFDWSNDASRSQFVAILASFQESIGRYFDVPRFDTTNMAFRIYVGCGGLVGYVAKFLDQLVWDAAESGARSVTLANLHAAHAKAVWKVEGKCNGPSPFTEAFKADPEDKAVLAIARRVGVESDAPGKTSKRTKKSDPASMNDTLRT